MTHLPEFAANLPLAEDWSLFFSCFCGKRFTVMALDASKAENEGWVCVPSMELGWYPSPGQDTRCFLEQLQLRYCSAGAFWSLEKIWLPFSWISYKNNSQSILDDGRSLRHSTQGSISSSTEQRTWDSLIWGWFWHVPFPCISWNQGGFCLCAGIQESLQETFPKLGNYWAHFKN